MAAGLISMLASFCGAQQRFDGALDCRSNILVSGAAAQELPPIASTMASADPALDLHAAARQRIISIPGVQKPHCRPCFSQNACCRRMQCADLAERFDQVLDGQIRRLGQRETETGPGCKALEQDGAGAAHAMLAADMRSGQTQLSLTNEVAQKQARARSSR